MLRAMLIILMLCYGSSCYAQLYVIVNQKNSLEQLTKNQLIDLYMGRTRHFESGSRVITVDAALQSPNREDFYQALVEKSVPEIQAYWARLLFTGRAVPPFQVESTGDIINFVGENASAIGYVEKAPVTDKVKVVYVLEK